METISIPSEVIRYYAQENGISLEEADRHFKELDKFLMVCSSTQERCAPSAALDKPWHAFL